MGFLPAGRTEDQGTGGLGGLSRGRGQRKHQGPAGQQRRQRLGQRHRQAQDCWRPVGGGAAAAAAARAAYWKSCQLIFHWNLQLM